jgi:uncharacterized protein (TIGR03437 family)
MEHLGLQSAKIAACIVLACPALAQFGPKQTLFRNSVLGWTGTLDVHGVASGQVTGPAATQSYKTDQHFSGLLKDYTYNPLTGAWVGTLDGTITVTETSTITFACTITNTYTVSTSAQTDSNGKPLEFNITFDSGSDTWSLWPSNDAVKGTAKSEQNCGGVVQTSSASQPLRFGYINFNMGFPFPASGFDLVDTRTITCPGCGNAASNPVTYTYTYNLKATTNQPTFTVTTNPAGRTIVVDGANLTAPQTFNWTPGSSHTLGAPSPQGSGARYLYSNWSDGGAQTHTVTAPNTSTTYTANYTLQYLLTTQASPTAGGKVTANPDSPDGYYSNGTTVQLTAAGNCGYQFANFGGDLTGATNPQSLVMNTPRSVTANFTVTGSSACLPSITPNGILNGASNARGQGAAAGGLVAIYGANLAAGTSQADRIPLPTALGGVSVTINGLAAPLLFVDKGQINAQVPWSVPAGTAAVIVTNNAAVSSPGSVQVVATSPGIFTVQYGVGQAIAINLDGTIAAPVGSIPGLTTHPANRGDTILIYATGLGAVSPAATDGKDSTDQLRNTVVTPTVLVGGIPALVQFSGLAPQFVGVNQLNVVVPLNTPTGDKVPLQLQMGGITTTDQVTIAIQ